MVRVQVQASCYNEVNILTKVLFFLGYKLAESAWLVKPSRTTGWFGVVDLWWGTPTAEHAAEIIHYATVCYDSHQEKHFWKIHIRNLTANFIIMGRPAGDASFSRDVWTLLKAQCYLVQNAFLSFVSGGKGNLTGNQIVWNRKYPWIETPSSLSTKVYSSEMNQESHTCQIPMK